MYDSHDQRVNYTLLNKLYEISKLELYSYKLKGAGFRTQVCVGVDRMVVGISDSNISFTSVHGSTKSSRGLWSWKSLDPTRFL